MPKQFSSDALNRVANFLKTQGRPLEQAYYAHLFEGDPREAVLDALQAFQNVDGGFGQGLEPDIRLHASSVIATTVAFQRFRALNVPASDPMVTAACRYLLDKYDSVHENWSNIPPYIDDAPHAPWWSYGDHVTMSMANPRAEIVGYLWDYPEHFPSELRARLTQAVTDHLLAQPDELEMHDAMCYIRLWETASLPADIKHVLLDKLRAVVNAIVERDPEAWKGYGVQPLTLIQSPGSPFAAGFADEIAANLDFLIESQSEDGAWYPAWSWEDLDAQAWAQARKDWASVLTLNNLLTLRAFGRLG